MHVLTRSILLIALALPAGGLLAVGCGSNKGTGTTGHGGNGGTGGTVSSSSGTTTGSSGTATGSSGAASSSGTGGSGFGDGGPGCLQVGGACMLATDCCSGACTGGVCNLPPCTSDNQACTSNGQCCGGNCTGGTCVPLGSTLCTGKTLGNTCTTNTDCCSKLCFQGKCSAPSFCTQDGDACATGAQCCGGVCNKSSPSALYGTCAQPPGGSSNCGSPDGALCAGGATLGDGGLPACGGACCSRLCAPYGPTNVLVCQPASGCHPVGDLCLHDSDCCGSAGLPGSPPTPVTCTITPPYTIGTCRNPQGCKPDGDVCKLHGTSCNASCDCCSGNCNNVPYDTCVQDSLGVPRCSAACVGPGQSCASSANCCNKLPCVPNPADGGTPPYICYQGGTCVPTCGKCTVNADCCPGTSCVVPVGSADGVCGPCLPPPPDGGTSSSSGTTSSGGSSSGTSSSSGTTSSSGGSDGGVCGLYGQQCSTTSPCCNGVPCTNMGGTPCTTGQTGCTCHIAIQ